MDTLIVSFNNTIGDTIEINIWAEGFVLQTKFRNFGGMG